MQLDLGGGCCLGGAQRTKLVLDTMKALFEEYKEESLPNLDTRTSQVQQNVESEANGLDPYENVSYTFSIKFCIKLNSEFS